MIFSAMKLATLLICQTVFLIALYNVTYIGASRAKVSSSNLTPSPASLQSLPPPLTSSCKTTSDTTEEKSTTSRREALRAEMASYRAWRATSISTVAPSTRNALLEYLRTLPNPSTPPPTPPPQTLDPLLKSLYTLYSMVFTTQPPPIYIYSMPPGTSTTRNTTPQMEGKTKSLYEKVVDALKGVSFETTTAKPWDGYRVGAKFYLR